MSRPTKQVTSLVWTVMHPKEDKSVGNRIIYWTLKQNMTLKEALVRAQRMPRVHHLRDLRNSKRLRLRLIVARTHTPEGLVRRRLQRLLTPQLKISTEMVRQEDEIDLCLLL